MKKKLLTLSALLLAGTLTFSQSKDKEWAISGSFGTSEYNGEIADEFFSFKQHAAYTLGVHKYLTPSWDAALTGTYTTFNAGDAVSYFQTNSFDLNLLAKFKFYNGKILKEDARIAPYLFAGLGDAFSTIYASQTKTEHDITPNFLGGLGFNINLTDSWALNLQSKYTYMWTDKIDNRVEQTKFNDQVLTTTAGIVYRFTAKKDADKDGVVDKEDKCPNVFGLAKFDGCPDTDADGLQDSEDDCPKVAGTLNGCPDTDKDGIADKDDACPSVAGLAKFAGCPDTDGDGVKDSEDNCPSVAGTINGCPDTDKDGVIDGKDACPKVAGLAKFDGCPDTDGDGVKDSEDKCPKLAGTIKNNGCPEADEESKKVFNEALEGLFFNSGSAVIKRTSYPVLDNVVRILKSHPTYKLKIEGHTDNTGDAAKNLTLSKARAAAAKTYLVNKGIDASRLTSDGYGITKPRADNSTPAGRQQNRRVEFTPVF